MTEGILRSRMTRRKAICIPLLLLACALFAQRPEGHTPSQGTNLQMQMRDAANSAKHGDADRALTVTGTILQQHPDFEPALKLRGMVLEQQGRNDEAAGCLKKALQYAPNDPDLLYSVGVDRLIAGDHREAITLLRKDLQNRPRDSDALYYLAQAYHLDGNNQLALKSIRGCLKLDPRNPSIWQKYGELLSSSGEDDKALEWLIKANQADPTLDRINYDLGAANLNSMKFDDALEYARTAVRDDPRNVVYHALLAAIELKLSMWADALVQFQRVLSEKDNDPSALLGLGRCQLELKDFQESIDTLQHLLAIDPTQISAHFYLSRAYSGVGETEEAKHESDLHKRMMEQTSFTRSSTAVKTPEEQAVLNRALELLEQGNEGQALARLEKSSPTEPGGALVLLGSMYLSLDESQDATRTLRHALQVNPRIRGAHIFLGIQAILQSDLAKAEAEFNAELGIDPNSATATAELGEIRYRQRRWAEAAELINKSRTSIPPLLYMLCDSYFQLGKAADADLTAEALASFCREDSNMMRALVTLLTRNQQAVLAQRLSSSLVGHNRF
jgi:tetratricopeptide (TPR) repeat protein